MSGILIAAALMKDASITALVSTRVGLAQLPQDTAFPALVYQIVTEQDRPYLAAWKESGRATFRLQLNPLAKTPAQVNAIHTAARALCMRLHGSTVAGFRILHVEDAGMGGFDKDNDAGVFTRPADYLITFDSPPP